MKRARSRFLDGCAADVANQSVPVPQVVQLQFSLLRVNRNVTCYLYYIYARRFMNTNGRFISVTEYKYLLLHML
jgi:hypothetical protein